MEYRRENEGKRDAGDRADDGNKVVDLFGAQNCDSAAEHYKQQAREVLGPLLARVPVLLENVPFDDLARNSKNKICEYTSSTTYTPCTTTMRISH
jgi:hypothetical protein